MFGWRVKRDGLDEVLTPLVVAPPVISGTHMSYSCFISFFFPVSFPTPLNNATTPACVRSPRLSAPSHCSHSHLGAASAHPRLQRRPMPSRSACPRLGVAALSQSTPRCTAVACLRPAAVPGAPSLPSTPGRRLRRPTTSPTAAPPVRCTISPLAPVGVR